jgi:hypothetical protein
MRRDGYYRVKLKPLIAQKFGLTTEPIVARWENDEGYEGNWLFDDLMFRNWEFAWIGGVRLVPAKKERQ